MACLVACETALQGKAATDARIAEAARQATSTGKQDRPFGNSGHYVLAAHLKAIMYETIRQRSTNQWANDHTSPNNRQIIIAVWWLMIGIAPCLIKPR